MPGNSATNKKELSAADRKKLQAYIDQADRLAAAEPQYTIGDDSSAAAWEKWNADCVALNEKYHDVIVKALKIQLFGPDNNENPGNVVEILRYMLNPQAATDDQAQNLLANSFLPFFNNSVTNELAKINSKSFTVDNVTKKATYKSGNVVFEIKNFDKLRGGLDTSAQKILDTSILHLTQNNYRNIIERAKVKIPLIEYGESCGYDLTPRKMNTDAEQEKENRRVDERIKDLKGFIRRDLTDIEENLVYDAVEKGRGRNSGNYIHQRIISSHRIVRENGEPMIEINFDIDAAAYLANSYISYFPTVLLKHDNRNPNAYAIGKRIALHNSNDHNAAKGTDCTLKVKTLLAAAPEIISYENLRANNQRNWKEKIKAKLEKALNENVRIGYIARWQYRNARTNETYTPEQANALSWDDYNELDVDFVLLDNPQQNERRERLAADKEKALQAAADDKEIPDLSENPEPL